MANVECVTCNTYKSLKYVKYKQLKFFAYCTNCGSIEAIYNWQIVGINDNKLVNLDNYTVLTPLDAPVLVLKSGVLDGLQSYKIVTNISVKGMYYNFYFYFSEKNFFEFLINICSYSL